MNKTDSPLVYSCAFWSLFYRFGNSVFSIGPYHSMSKQKILPVEPLIQCEAGRAKTMQRQSLYSPRTPKRPPSDKGECSKTKSRLHTKISTVVRSEVVCASKIHPAPIFSRKAKAPSFANLGECFVVKNPHAFGWK